LERLRCCALPVCGFGEGERPANPNFDPIPSALGFSGVEERASFTIIDGKQFAALCRIKALWRLRYCALTV
jgi:hypothetical protein